MAARERSGSSSSSSSSSSSHKSSHASSPEPATPEKVEQPTIPPPAEVIVETPATLDLNEGNQPSFTINLLQKQPQQSSDEPSDVQSPPPASEEVVSEPPKVNVGVTIPDLPPVITEDKHVGDDQPLLPPMKLAEDDQPVEDDQPLLPPIEDDQSILPPIKPDDDQSTLPPIKPDDDQPTLPPIKPDDQPLLKLVGDDDQPLVPPIKGNADVEPLVTEEVSGQPRLVPSDTAPLLQDQEVNFELPASDEHEKLTKVDLIPPDKQSEKVTKTAPKTRTNEKTSLLGSGTGPKKYSSSQPTGKSESQEGCCAGCCVVL